MDFLFPTNYSGLVYNSRVTTIQIKKVVHFEFEGSAKKMADFYMWGLGRKGTESGSIYIQDDNKQGKLKKFKIQRIIIIERTKEMNMQTD